MKTFRSFLLRAFLVYSFATSVLAQTSLASFMSSQDVLQNDPSSNIYLQNTGSAATTVYGVYVRQYGLVDPGDNCDSPEPIYPGTNNITAGALVTPTLIRAGNSASVGQNYLYNMIFQAIYYERIIIPSSPPGCALPGCTWGDDTTIYNWCIYLGALAPVSRSDGYTSSVPPSTYLASDAGLYNYNLISSYVTLGPISCSDQTLSCTVESPQTQPFP